MNELDMGRESESIQQIRNSIANLDIHLTSTDIEVDVDNAIKLPLDQIPALGVGLSSLPTMFRSVTTTINAPALLRVTDKAGNPLDPSALNKFKDGTGMIGSFKDGATGLGQARFHQADLNDIQGVSTIPYDPTVLFMAAALSQINQKLDAIQDTVNEMFEYMRQKDKAELRGNVKTLEDTLDAYRHNWNNDIWRKNAHMKVIDIKQESEKAIIHLRSQIKSKLGDKAPIELRIGVNARLDEILDRMKEYQLAVYTYSFTSFLEPMLSENFDGENLRAIAGKISEQGNEYRELYTKCYNEIESCAKSSADTALLGGVSAVFSGLGGLIKQTPIGDVTPIDNVLEDAGKGVGEFNENQTKELLGRLEQAKTPDIIPFRESLESIDKLHNSSHQIAIDEENVYLIEAQSNA